MCPGPNYRAATAWILGYQQYKEGPICCLSGYRSASDEYLLCPPSLRTHALAALHPMHLRAHALSSSSPLPRREHPLPVRPLAEGSCSAHGSRTWHFHHWVADVKMTLGKVHLTLADFSLSCLLNFLNVR